MCQAWLRSVQTFVTTASFFFAGSVACRCGAKSAAPAVPRKVRRVSMMHLKCGNADFNRGRKAVQQSLTRGKHMLTPKTRKRDFPSLEGRAYLNSAAEGIPPLAVGEALQQYFEDKQ